MGTFDFREKIGRDCSSIRKLWFLNQKRKHDYVVNDPNDYVCGNLDLFVVPVEQLLQKMEDPHVLDCAFKNPILGFQKILDSAITPTDHEEEDEEEDEKRTFKWTLKTNCKGDIALKGPPPEGGSDIIDLGQTVSLVGIPYKIDTAISSNDYLANLDLDYLRPPRQSDKAVVSIAGGAESTGVVGFVGVKDFKLVRDDQVLESLQKQAHEDGINKLEKILWNSINKLYRGFSGIEDILKGRPSGSVSKENLDYDGHGDASVFFFTCLYKNGFPN